MFKAHVLQNCSGLPVTCIKGQWAVVKILINCILGNLGDLVPDCVQSITEKTWF